MSPLVQSHFPKNEIADDTSYHKSDGDVLGLGQGIAQKIISGIDAEEFDEVVF